MKFVLLIAFILILGALAGAGVFMLRKGRERNKSMAWALTARIGISVALFLFILLAALMGWIRPTGLPLK
jgi:hypothetical protein